MLSKGLVYEIVPTTDKTKTAQVFIKSKSQTSFSKDDSGDEVSINCDKLISTRRGVINQVTISATDIMSRFLIFRLFRF